MKVERTMEIILRVITDGGEIVSEEEFDNEFEACEAMEEVVGEDLAVQVIVDGLIYAEKLL